MKTDKSDKPNKPNKSKKTVNFILYSKNKNTMEITSEKLNNFFQKKLNSDKFKVYLINKPIKVNDNNLELIKNIFLNIPKNNSTTNDSISSSADNTSSTLSLSSSSSLNLNSTKQTGGSFQIGDYVLKINLQGDLNIINQNLFSEGEKIIIDGVEYIVILDKNTHLNDLNANWKNITHPGGKVVNEYVGVNQPAHRRARFDKSVSYLKGITERLRDCTDISQAYEKKHQEVLDMIVTIRKLYGLVLFLRDQINKNQENYDTLEKLILEITLAMNKDYHIPQRELTRLKQIQEKISDDSKELEKKFRVVSNQILNRLEQAGALDEKSPTFIGPGFPVSKDLGISPEKKFTPEQLEDIGAEYYTMAKNNKRNEYKNQPFSETTQLFKTEKGPDGKYRGTGEHATNNKFEHQIEPHPLVYSKPKDNKSFGTFHEARKGKLENRDKIKANARKLGYNLFENHKNYQIQREKQSKKNLSRYLKSMALSNFLSKQTPNLNMVNFLTNKERKLTMKNIMRKRARNQGEINKLSPNKAFNIKRSRKNLNKITPSTNFNNKVNNSTLNTGAATFLKNLTTPSAKLPFFKKSKKSKK